MDAMLQIPAIARRTARATLLVLAAGGALAPAAFGHGGTTLAEGQRDGVTVRVQGSDVATDAGVPGADLATTLAGPGSGEGSKIVYWVRPDGGKTFKVTTERDPGGVHHAEIPTTDRGDWRAWDVSAVVTLTGGETLRVTNAEGSAPGPDPAQAADEREAELRELTESAQSSTPPSTPGADAEATNPDANGDGEAAAPEDISGEEDGAPTWAFITGGIAVLLGLIGVVYVARRDRREHAGDAGDDWGN